VESASAQALLDEGREAAARCDWDVAYRALRKADERGESTFDELALLAEVAYATGDLDATIDTWERAHAQSVAGGDRPGAAVAATRIAMHLMMDTGLMAPVRAWIRRAEHLLEGQDEGPVDAWLAVARTYERLLSGDFGVAEHWARRAVEIGEAQHAAAPAAMGRIAEARGAILAGDVRRGLELLDDAAVVTISGEVDPLTVGLIYCELVCAWQGLAQYDRAEEWTEAMERWCVGHRMGSVQGRCRVHRAEILRLRGSCDEAEDEANAACVELRPTLRREFGWPLGELGRIRLQKGDLAGAEEALLEAYEVGWEPQPEYAQLLLALGDVPAAFASIEDALDHPLDIPSKERPPNTDLRRAPLLAALVEIGVAAGQRDRARWASAELSRIAVAYDSEALQACAATACGQVLLADDGLLPARTAFERAVRLWTRLGAPFEAGQARMGLATSLRRGGLEVHALREFRAARAAFDRIGARTWARSAARAAGDDDTAPAPGPTERRDADLAPTSDGPGSAPNVFRREGDYWSLAFDGDTIRLHDLRGLAYLARLLGDPGREFHAADLVAAERVATAGALTASVDPELRTGYPADSGPMLDAQAKAAYRRRLLEVEQDIEEAQAFGDQERASRAELDREFLIRELAGAVGLHGRDRRSGSASERARASVTRAVRHAIKRIGEHHPTLGEHLDRTVRTGTYCVYLPDPRVREGWEF
jgi:tetratricopeptide (TPR) repeat protein